MTLAQISLAKPHGGLQQLQRPASSMQRPAPRLRVLSFAAPVHVQQLANAGPGSGHRHYPEELRQQYEPRQRMDDGGPAERRHHDMMSTEQCYALFPLLTHASTPLRVEDAEPAGVSALRVGDAGPATGRRRRPAPADTAAQAHHAMLPYPDTRPTDLHRELLARHAPEQLLRQV